VQIGRLLPHTVERLGSVAVVKLARLHRPVGARTLVRRLQHPGVVHTPLAAVLLASCVFDTYSPMVCPETEPSARRTELCEYE